MQYRSRTVQPCPGVLFCALLAATSSVHLEYVSSDFKVAPRHTLLALLTLYTVGTVDNVDTFDTFDTVDTDDTVDTFDTVDC